MTPDQCVKRGVRWLNRVSKGWRKKILKKDQLLRQDHILVQLFGKLIIGRMRVYQAGYVPPWVGLAVPWCMGDDARQEWGLKLETLWRKEIEQ